MLLVPRRILHPRPSLQLMRYTSSWYFLFPPATHVTTRILALLYPRLAFENYSFHVVFLILPLLPNVLLAPAIVTARLNRIQGFQMVTLQVTEDYPVRDFLIFMVAISKMRKHGSRQLKIDSTSLRPTRNSKLLVFPHS